MKWLKDHWSLLAGAIVAAFYIWRQASQQGKVQKWKDKAVAIEEGNVTKGTMTAEAAGTRAKLHAAKAKEIKANAEQAVKKKNESTADILARWS